MSAIGIGISPVFKKKSGSGGYWTTRYISALSVATTSASTQTVTATIVGTGYDGVSFEYSTDNGATWSAGIIDADGVLSQTGLISNTTYFWRARLYKGTNYGNYSIVDYATTSVHTSLLAGWKLDKNGPDWFSNTMGDGAFLGYINLSSAIYYNGKTYVAYSGDGTGANDAAFITTYTHATGLWATPVKVGDIVIDPTDDHGAPAILIDNDGYIHCMYGAHNSAIYYSKSNNPENISAWTSMTSPTDGTYPQLMQFSDDTIYLFYRGDYFGETGWNYRTSTNGGTTFGAYTGIVSVADGFSYCYFKKGVGDFIHCTFMEQGTTPTSLDRENIHYMRYDGAWKNISGTAITTPVALPSPNTLAYDSGVSWIPNNVYHWDGSNNPVIFFTEGVTSDPGTDMSGTFTYKVLKHNGTAWVSYSLGISTDNLLDFATAIDVRTANDIDVYLIRKGTADAIGGNVEKWTSADGGVTWALSEVIKEGQLLNPVMVVNYNSNAKVVFAEYNDTDIAWTGKGYLWGDSGFIINPTFVLAPDIKVTNPLTIYNAPTSEVGAIGNAFVFVGTSSQYLGHIDDNVFSFAGGSPDLPFTIAFWLKVADTAALKLVFAKFDVNQNEYQFYINANTFVAQLMELASGENILASAPFTETGVFVFLCITYDGGGAETGIKIYKNCTESQTVQTETGTYTGMTNGTSIFTIGRRAAAATPYYLTGSIDNFKIYNKVLNPTEMAAEMTGTL